MASGAAPEELPHPEEPEPVFQRGIGLSVALGVVVALAAGVLQAGLCQGNAACMAIPFSLLAGGGTAGYVARRRAAFVGALVGIALVTLAVVALLVAALSHRGAGGPAPALPWRTPESLARFLVGALLTVAFTALGGVAGDWLRRYVEQGE